MHFTGTLGMKPAKFTITVQCYSFVCFSQCSLQWCLQSWLSQWKWTLSNENIWITGKILTTSCEIVWKLLKIRILWFQVQYEILLLGQGDGWHALSNSLPASLCTDCLLHDLTAFRHYAVVHVCIDVHFDFTSSSEPRFGHRMRLWCAISSLFGTHLNHSNFVILRYENFFEHKKFRVKHVPGVQTTFGQVSRKAKKKSWKFV